MEKNITISNPVFFLDNYKIVNVAKDLWDESYNNIVNLSPLENKYDLVVAHRELGYLIDIFALELKNHISVTNPNYFSGLSEKASKDLLSLNAIHNFLLSNLIVPPASDSLISGLSIIIEYTINLFNRFEKIVPNKAPLPNETVKIAENLHSAAISVSGNSHLWQFTDESILGILFLFYGNEPMTKLELDLLSFGKLSLTPEMAYRSFIMTPYLKRDYNHRYSLTQLALDSCRKNILLREPEFKRSNINPFGPY